MWVRSLGLEDPLEKEMATHSIILVWRIPWTQEPGCPQSIGSHRVGHNWSNLAHNTYGLEIPLLDITLKKTIIHKDTCISVFVAALFTTGKTRKQSKCPLTDEQIKKMWCIYTMEYYYSTMKNEIMPFAVTWIDLEITVISELCQAENDKDHLYVESKIKEDTGELI